MKQDELRRKQQQLFLAASLQEKEPRERNQTTFRKISMGDETEQRDRLIPFAIFESLLKGSQFLPTSTEKKFLSDFVA